MLGTPIIVVNFKLYRQASGENAVHLAEILNNVAIEYGVNIAVAVNALDFRAVKNTVDIPVLLQHIDPVDFGAHTGQINPELAREAGADGILVNHSERTLKLKDIEKLVTTAKVVGLKTIVCTNNPSVSGAVAFMAPDFIAMEPPELIGGNISVSKARPEAITRTISMVNTVREIPVLVGAGVKTSEDVRRGIELGAHGVLVASGITKANDPHKAIMELVQGLI